MRKILTFLLIWNAVMTLQAEPRIAFLNFKYITEQYQRSKTAGEELKTAQEKLKQDLQTQWDSFQELVDHAVSLQKEINDPLLPQDTRFQKHQEFKALELKIEMEKKKLREFKANREKVFHQRYHTQTETVLQEITQATAKLAKEKSYDLVLNNSDVTSHASTFVQYIKSENDITSELLNRLNGK